MTMYLYGYKSTPEAEQPRDPHRPWDNVDVCYTPDPQYTWPLEWATIHCKEINGMRAHVGEHYCQFEVEEVQEGKFAIVCKTHPLPVNHGTVPSQSPQL